jgi:hypothetical protein
MKVLDKHELNLFFALSVYTDIVQRKGDIRGYWENSMCGDSIVHVSKLMSKADSIKLNNFLTWLYTTHISLEERTRRNAVNGLWMG